MSDESPALGMSADLRLAGNIVSNHVRYKTTNEMKGKSKGLGNKEKGSKKYQEAMNH